MNELITYLNQIKDRWGAETVAAIRRRIQEANLVHSGVLDRSILYEQDQTSGDISFFMADYGTFQDLGVNGTSQNQESPYSFKADPTRKLMYGTARALTEWSNSKGLNPFAVATVIRKKGIEPKRFFNSVIEQRLQVLGTELTDGMSEYMNRTITAYQNRQQNP